MPDEAPPLKTWGYVASVVFFILALFITYSYAEFRDKDINSLTYLVADSYQKSMMEAIINNNTHGSSELSVVIFGSSLTATAFSDAEAMARALSQKLHKRVHILVLPIFGLNMDQAEYSKFFNYVTLYPPQFLFIENNRLHIEEKGYKREKSVSFLRSLADIGYGKMPIPFTLSLTNIIYHTKKIAGLKIETDFNPVPPSASPFYTDKFDSATYRTILSGKRVARSFSQNAVANDAYAKLLNKCTKVIFVDLPRTSTLEQVYLDNEQKNRLGDLLASCNKEYGIECWKYQPAMPDSNFYDGGHLNYKGARIYKEWFIDKLVSLQ